MIVENFDSFYVWSSYLLISNIVVPTQYRIEIYREALRIKNVYFDEPDSQFVSHLPTVHTEIYGIPNSEIVRIGRWWNETNFINSIAFCLIDWLINSLFHFVVHKSIYSWSILVFRIFALWLLGRVKVRLEITSRTENVEMELELFLSIFTVNVPLRLRKGGTIEIKSIYSPSHDDKLDCWSVSPVRNWF